MGDEAGPSCVKVATRCRPPSQKEIGNGEQNIVEMQEAFGEDGLPGCVILSDPAEVEKPAEFAFDIVFGLAIEQVQIYKSVGRPALMKTFEGFNGTIFAYGQTGSGKSWSMGGGPGDLRGITPRVNQELFEHIALQQVDTTRRFLVMCSYFEIYNEIIFDLLNPVADRAKLGGGLQIKEHPVMGVYVKDLTEIVSEDREKLDSMIDSGAKNRAVSSTAMNSVSSRSHSIFSIKVHQKDEEDASRNVFAKLNLVDLAGSERQKGTGATGQTLKEGANINKSLSALGNVINSLVESANGKKVFIPYRNSKLTRVLQESLGGNSLCTMLATLSPAACNYEETMSTLRYANRAKAIKVSATKNEEASQISRLKAEVEELKKKLSASGSGGGGVGGLSEEERRLESEKHEKHLKEMEVMLNSSWGDKASLSAEHEKTMQRLKEDRQRAAQALEEERAKRFRLLQEKDDPELTVRGLIDFISGIPKIDGMPTVLTGENPRQWMKSLRALKQYITEIREDRTLVLVFQKALEEDVRLFGEGIDSQDISLALGGLNRCVPKLDKLRKGGDGLNIIEAKGLVEVASIEESIGVAMDELKILRDKLAEDAEAAASVAAASGNENGKAATVETVDEISRILAMVPKQMAKKAEELVNLGSLDLGSTCSLVLQSSRSCPGATAEAAEGAALLNECGSLQALIADPRLAALPPPMPAKPIRDYEVTDVMDTPEATQALIGTLVRWETLAGGKNRKPASELLARPPPKFVLDIAVALKAATGFPPELEEAWPEAREERLGRLQSIADAVAKQLNTTVDFDPADVLKGKEVPKTLRFLELAAVAAAKHMPPSPSGDGTPRGGVVRAREISAMLSGVGRCLQGAKAILVSHQATVQQKPADEGHVQEEDSAERTAAAELKLQEEIQNRAKYDEMLVDVERQLEEAQAEVKRLANECELAGVGKQDAEQVELERQVKELLNDASSPVTMTEETMLKVLQGQLDEVKRELERDEASVQELESQHKELERKLNESLQQKAQIEAEVQLERQRCQTEKDLAGQSTEDQKLILQAHEAKLNSRCEALETQITQTQAEVEERKINVAKLTEERNDLQAKAEDACLQMQIVQEERDAMREAMEQLWNQWAVVDEELNNHMVAYINLSERLNAQQDEYCELESLVSAKQEEVAGLQKNGFNMSATH
eukprot:TRINITY_DN39467_c0_g1_i1.p1 TRINITY_DN39467_c0_g1~~TRINITY_DN39467_c0_g1_i1.p1  ORF type:complete len:1182 (+),score=304.74 TRINITY_DN39467_c0_g1_i1:85-3630(+)